MWTIACARRTIAAALLQAVDMRIAKIPAARTLREVAAERRQMPNLRRGETRGRGRQARIGRGDSVIAGNGRNGRHCADAAKKATSGAKPLSMTGYKLDLLSGLVRDLLEQLAK